MEQHLELSNDLAMKTYLIIMISLLTISCGSEKIYEETFDEHTIGSVVHTIAVGAGSLQNRIQLNDDSGNMTATVMQDPNNLNNQVLKTSGAGVFELLIDDYPSQIDQVKVAFSVTASNNGDMGYVSLEDAADQSALGIDLSDNHVMVHGYSKRLSFEVAKKISFFITLNTKTKRYSIDILSGETLEQPFLANKQFTDFHFGQLTKLRFSLNGAYIIDDVQVTEVKKS